MPLPQASTGAPAWQSKRRFLVVLALALAVELLLIGWQYRNELPLDLRIYVWGGSTVGHDAALYERLAYDHWFTYPPFAAVTFAPLAALPVPLLQVLWPALSLGCLAVAVHACLRFANWSVRPVSVVALLVASIVLEPIRHTFSLGQINLVLFAMIMVDLLRSSLGRRAGIGIGIATAIKLTPGIFIVLLLLARRTRDAVTAAASFAICTLVGFAVAPEASKRYWLHLSHDTDRVGAPYIGNQSPYGALSRLLEGKENIGAWYLVIPAFFAVVGLGTAALLVRRNQWLEGLTVTGVTGLLVSPISWTHHWVWCVPALMVLYKAGATARACGAGAFLLFALAPMWWTPHHGGPHEYGLHGMTSLVANSFLVAGIAFVAFLAVVSVRPLTGAARDAEQFAVHPLGSR